MKLLILLTITFVVAEDASEESNKLTPVIIPPRKYIQSSVQVLIVGGNAASKHQFPWQASVMSCEGNVCNICGGSLISGRHVLTAAHCTDGLNAFRVGLGSNSLKEPVLQLNSRTKHQHPMYDEDAITYDISIVVLPRKVTETTKIRIISLATANMGSLEGRAVVASGYGKTGDRSGTSNTLNYVNMRVISNRECNRYYSRRTVNSKVLCAVGRDRRNQNICSGDSGGPLVMKQGAYHVQVGIVSFGSATSCSRGFPSGFTRVSEYADWIKEKTGLK